MPCILLYFWVEPQKGAPSGDGSDNTLKLLASLVARPWALQAVLTQLGDRGGGRVKDCLVKNSSHGNINLSVSWKIQNTEKSVFLMQKAGQDWKQTAMSRNMNWFVLDFSLDWPWIWDCEYALGLGLVSETQIAYWKVQREKVSSELFHNASSSPLHFSIYSSLNLESFISIQT